MKKAACGIEVYILELDDPVGLRRHFYIGV